MKDEGCLTTEKKKYQFFAGVNICTFYVIFPDSYLYFTLSFGPVFFSNVFNRNNILSVYTEVKDNKIILHCLYINHPSDITSNTSFHVHHFISYELLTFLI